MDVQVKIELGHRATPRSVPTTEGFTHDWTVYVRGPDSCNISHFVEKVVFVLHPSFPDPIRVCKEPPYHVAEKGYASFEFPIEIHFRNKAHPRSLKYKYNLLLHMHEPVNSSRCEKLTFQNPTDEFKKKLIKGGGTVIRQPEEVQFTSLFGPPIKTTESPKKPKQPTVASKEKPPRLSLDDSSKPVSGKSKDKDSSSSKSSSSNKSSDGHVTKDRSHKDKHSSKDSSRKHTDSPSLSSSGSSGKRYSESPTNHEQSKKLKRSSSSSSFADKKSKDKDRDAEREKQKELEKEREKEAERARKEAEKEREKERLKEIERENQREKEKEAARQKEIEKEKLRELAREKEREEKEREKKEHEKEKMKEKERQRRKEKKEKEKLNTKTEKSSKRRHSSNEKPKNRDKENLNDSSHKQKSPITDIEVKKREEIDERPPKSISHSKTDSPSRSIKREDHKKPDKPQSDKYHSKTKNSKDSTKSVKSEKPPHKEKIKESKDSKVIAHKKNLDSESKPLKAKKSDDSITSYRNKLANVTISELKNDLSGSDSSDSPSVSSLSSSSVPGSDSGSDNESENESVSSKSRKSSSSSKASTPRKSALGTLIAELEVDESEDDIPEPGSVFSTHSAGSRHSPSRSVIDNKPVFSNHSSGSRPSPSQHEDNKSEKNGHKSKLSPGQRFTKDKHSSDVDRDDVPVKSPKKRARVSSKDKSAINTNSLKSANAGVLTHSESKGFDVYNHSDDHLSPASRRSSVGIADEAPHELMESQNGEELTELVALQRKLMSIKDPNILVKVVMLIQKVGKFKIGEASTFDFDLCSLDSSTVQEIRTYIGQA